jgi:hypothetical protein
MKNTFALTKRIFLSALVAGILFTGCMTRKEAHQPSVLSANADDKTIPSYVTTKEITAMAPRTGTFVKRLSVYAGSFRTADGKEFMIGSPAGEQWVWHFLGTLKEGQSCKFPDAFVDYQSAPYYVTGKDIAAMAPRTGTLATRTPCSAYFTTADGKGFGIGDPGSEKQISQFLWSLKDGQTCRFPDVFLQYQKSPEAKQP